jgi:hypothetical protein
MNMGPPLTIFPLDAESEVSSHPSVFLTVPKHAKILGGGAIIEAADPSVDPANFLTASYPIDSITWFAAGKDHEVSFPARIKAFVFALQDDGDIWDVRIVSASGPGAVSHPKAVASLPGDYVLTGGGAFVDYHGAGNMLTASFPIQPLGNGDWYAWKAHSKDHQIFDPARLTAYAIGIRLKSAPEGAPGVQNHVVFDTDSQPASKPEILSPVIGPPFQLTGGGAWDKYGTGAGNMLNASAPFLPSAQAGFWNARGSDHLVASPAEITAWAIGLALQPDSAPTIARHRDRHKASYL